MFAHVTYVEQRGASGFVCGTAMSGRQSIAFDSYSLQQGANGLYIGPVLLKGCGNNRHADVVHKNAVLYGWAVLSKPGCFRFATAIVAPELHYFWMNLTRGPSFLCSTSNRLMLEAGDGGKPFADLFVLALVFAGDCRPVLHQCFLQNKRPPVFANLRLQTPDPVKFIVAACMLSFSAEPFKQLASLISARQAEVDPSTLKSLQLFAGSVEQLTPAALQKAILLHKQQALQRLRIAQGISYRKVNSKQKNKNQPPLTHLTSKPASEMVSKLAAFELDSDQDDNQRALDSNNKPNAAATNTCQMQEEQPGNSDSNDDDEYPESPGVLSDDETAYEALLSVAHSD